MSYKEVSFKARLRLDARAVGQLSRSDELEGYFSPHCPPSVPLVGKSSAMLETLKLIRMVAQSQCNPVLILGETGTGKELAAQCVHAWRGGGKEDFIAVNCAALTGNLLESELFGHVRGAFTGADRDKKGLFEVAGDGTIFLDEISELSRELQPKFLRVLQEQKFRKVGGTQDIPSRATIITSSNRDLLAEVRGGGFRKDLYYRLAVFPITMPSLRSPERRSDITLLARYFLKTSQIRSSRCVEGLTHEAEQILLGHDWPGNVRELRNVIARAQIVEKAKEIHPDSIVLDLVETSSTVAKCMEESHPKDLSLESAERQFIRRALEETGWGRAKAARLLGITRATLHAKLKRYDIKPPDSGEGGPENDDTSSDESLYEPCP